MALDAEVELNLEQMVSAFQVDWRSVGLRLRSHPHEARTVFPGGQHSILHMVLERRRSNYAPFQVIRRLLAIFPEAAWLGIESFSSPLHIVARCNPLPEFLKLIRAARPAVPQDSRAILYLWQYHVNAMGSEKLLVEFLTEGSREAARVYVELSQLVEYTLKQPMRPVKYALHTVAALTCDFDLLQLTIEELKEQACMRDDTGRFPLHTFLATKADGRTLTLDNDNLTRSFRFPFDLLPLLRSLVNAHPPALSIRDDQGQLPIHVAIEAGWDDFDILLTDYPDSLDAVDGKSGWLPYQLAAVSPEASLDAVYNLLRRHPSALRIPYGTVDESHPVDNHEKILDLPHTLIQNATFASVPEDVRKLVFKVGKAECSRLWKSLQRVLTKAETLAEHSSPVHYLARLAHCPESLLRVMSHFHFTDLRRPDSLGRLPLHWVVTVGIMEENDYMEQKEEEDKCSYLDRLEYLLQTDPAACFHFDHNGQLPIHVAAENSLPLEGLRQLLKAYPKGLLLPDGRTKLPPVLAGAQHLQLDALFTLLSAAPDAIHLHNDSPEMIMNDVGCRTHANVEIDCE